jgi:hypothetical protein
MAFTHHVSRAATDASPRTGSVALEAVSPGLERIFSPSRRSSTWRRAPQPFVFHAGRAVLFFETPRACVDGLSGMARSPNVGRPALCYIVAGSDGGGRAGTISLRSELGGDSAQDDRQSFGSIASIIGVRHPSRMESVDGKVWFRSAL